MSILIYGLYLLIFIVLFEYFYVWYQVRKLNLPNVPVAWGYPLVRQIYHFIKYGSLVHLSNLREKHGDLFLIASGSPVLINVNPDNITPILKSSNDRNQNVGDVFQSVFKGKGLFALNGTKWKKHRGIISPVFQATNLKSLMWILTDSAANLADKWESLVDNSSDKSATLNVIPEFKNLTFDTIGQAAFGVNFNTINGTQSPVIKAIDGCFSLIDYRLKFSAYPYYKLLPNTKVHNQWIKCIQDTVTEIIKKKVESKTFTKEKPDLLDILLNPEIGSDLSTDDIIQEVVTFMVAGTETTATSLTFFMGCVSQNVDVQEKIHDEVMKVIGMNTPTYDDFKKLTYTENCLKEALRLYPVAFAQGRYITKDTEVNDLTLKEGLRVLSLTMLINRSPKYFKDPLKYSPERWQKDEIEGLPSHVYMPFGGGLRICVGKTFAWNEMMSVIVTLFQRFKFEAINPQWPIPSRPSFALNPTVPITVKIEKR